MNKTVVVDFENCCSSRIWNLFKEKFAYWEIILVVGPNQFIKSDKITRNMKIERSQITRKNSADFVVVSIAVMKLMNIDTEKVCILSNDKGFDSAIEFLESNGYNIYREGTNSVVSEPKKNVNKDTDRLNKLGSRYIKTSQKYCSEINKLNVRDLSVKDRYNAMIVANELMENCTSGASLEHTINKLHKNLKNDCIERSLEILIKMQLVNVKRDKNVVQIGWKKKDLQQVKFDENNLELMEAG